MTMTKKTSLGFFIDCDSQIHELTQSMIDSNKADIVVHPHYTEVRTLGSDYDNGYEVRGEYVLHEKLEDLMTIIRGATGVELELN